MPTSIRQAERANPAGLDAFMHALGAVESGNNWDAVGPYTGSTYGRARGRWQIMEKIYPAWAREAGVDPNDYSPAAQERVARHKMSQYYNRYGSWDLVAVAWFAGPGRADKAKKSGISSVGGMKDMLGTSVSGYVQKVMNGMSGVDTSAPSQRTAPANPRQADLALGVGSESQRGVEQGMGMAEPGRLAPVQATPESSPVRQQLQADQMTQDNMAEILSFVSKASRDAGGGVLDLKGFLGMPSTPNLTQSLERTADAQQQVVPEPETVPDDAGEAAPESPRQADGPLAEPPEHEGFDGLTDEAKVGTQQLMAKFPGLRFTSGYRDPKRNAAAGGVQNSKHLTGQASDFVGSEEEMQAAAAWAKSQGAKVLIHNAGSGRHLHIEWP